MAGRCALIGLCTALAIAAAAGPADGFGQQVSDDDQRPELVDWPDFERTPNALLDSDRLGVEPSAGNGYGPVKSRTFRISNGLKRLQQVQLKPISRTTSTTTLHPFLREQPRQSWEDKWPQAHSFWVNTPDMKTLKKIDKAVEEEEKEKKAEEKKKKEAEKKKNEKKDKKKKKRKTPTTTPKPFRKPLHPWRSRRNLIRRAVVADTETSRDSDVESLKMVLSGLHGWSQQQPNWVQRSRPRRRSLLPRVLPSADSFSRVH